jgi:hypothetical protein
VVSTLNLLRTKDGHSLVTTFTRTLDVSHFDVYSDVADAGLYFVVLRRDDGSSAGELAYQMGWSKPRSTTPSMARLGISTAPFKVVQESKTDPRHKIGSFTSTLPA